MNPTEKRRAERGTTAHADEFGITSALLRALADEDDGWKARAACRGLDAAMFFPDTKGQNCTAAKRVCATCPVTFECADYGARFSPREGVWGGMSVKERRRWRRLRGFAADRPQFEVAS